MFWTLTGVVCLSPLPLASNRPLPWSVLSLVVGLLLATWAVDRALARGGWFARRSSRPASSPAAVDAAAAADPSAGRAADRLTLGLGLGFIGLLGWYWVQTVPGMPGGLAHPAWREAAATLGEPLTGTMALDAGAARTTLMKIAAYGGVFFLAFQLCRDRHRARWAFIAIALAGLAYAMFGLIAFFAKAETFFGMPKIAYLDSVTSTFVNRNSYATYAGVCVFAAMALLLSELRHVLGERMTFLRLLRNLSEEGSLVLYLSLLAIGVGVMALVLTASRGGVISLVAAGVVFAVAMLLARDIGWRLFLGGVGVGGVALLAAVVLGGSRLATRMVDTGLDIRGTLYHISMRALAERPLTGHGLGGYGDAFNRANLDRPFDVYVDLAHNSYLELAVEGGIPALLLSLVLVGAGIVVCARGVVAQGRGTSLAIGALAAGVMVATHAMLDFSFQMPAVAATFLFLSGAASAQTIGAPARVRAHPLESASRGDGRARDHRRRKRRTASGRPMTGDDAVTPAPEIPAPARATLGPRAAMMPLRQGDGARIGAAPPADDPLGRGLGSNARWAESEGVASQPAAAAARPSDGEDYQLAMARWRALREGVATARPAPPPVLAETAVASTPGVSDAPIPVDVGAGEPPPKPAGWPGQQSVGQAAPRAADGLEAIFAPRPR